MLPRRQLSDKIGHSYDPEKSRKIFEDTQKEKLKLLEKLRPSKPRNVLEENIPKGKATAQNSLRMRGKGLSVKIGKQYDMSASMKAHRDSNKEQQKIREMRKPMKPNNPIAEEVAKGNASPKNSLRMRYGKALSKKVQSTYDQKASRKSFEETSKELNGIVSRLRPVKPRNPIAEKEVVGEANMKNSLRMRQKKLSAKVCATYNEKQSHQCFEDSQKVRYQKLKAWL